MGQVLVCVSMANHERSLTLPTQFAAGMPSLRGTNEPIRGMRCRCRTRLNSSS